ncbi:beta strand repeat-containing protein, partial [Flavobacterium sp. LB1P71]
MKAKITLLLLTLFMFVGNIYSQFDTNHPDLRSCNYSCPSGNITAKNVYLSATVNDGTPLEDIYPTCTAGLDTYSVTIWLNYTQNQNNDIPNTRVFATLSIGGGTPIQINTYVGTLTSTKGTSGGKIKLTTVPINWVCGQTLSFTNILVVWKPGNGDSQLNANSTYGCQTYSNSQCEFGTTTVFTAPLAVQYDYSVACTTNTGVAVQFSNTTNGGKAPFSYLWNFGDGTTSTAISPLHNYTTTGGNVTVSLTVTDSRSPTPASNTTSKIIFIPNKLVTSISQQTNISCNGGNNGSATATSSGGTGPYTYSWNSTPVQTTAIATGLLAGAYTITVTDVKGCITNAVATITQPAALSALATTTTVLCSGGNGSIDLTVSGGTSPYTYLWSNGATTQDISGVIAGTYAVTITDANGCSVQKSVTINAAPTEISFTATATQPKCFGEKGAVVLSTPTGGTGNITFGSTATTNLAAGNYTYTATDANGCSVQKSVTINAAPTEISFTATATQPKCFGEKGAVVLSTPTGGTGNITFGSTATTNLAAGNYTYTATDVNGCSVQKSVTINAVPNEISFTATATQPKCFGEKGAVVLSTPTGGTGNITFGSTATTNLAAGDYTYTATDANGCSVQKSVTINAAPNEISFTATATQPKCFGEKGSVVLSTPAGGTGNIAFDSTATTNLAAGVYTYTATDANGCSTQHVVTINAVPNEISFKATATQPKCFGEKGSVVLNTPTGGTGTINFNSTATTELAVGDYTYIATDTNGCSTQHVVTINAAPTAISFTATPTQPKCVGEKGSVVLSTPTGGTGTINFNSTATTNLVAGDYTYTATDANGCSVQKSVTINAAPTEISFTATATQPKCFGEKGAVVLSTPTGGTGNITFGSTATTNLAAGNYTYTATDANGCSVQKSVTINAVPTEISFTATATQPKCFGEKGAVVLSTPTGGTGNITFGSTATTNL